MEGIPLNMVKLKDWTENVGKKNKKNIAKVQNVFKLTSESLENYYKYIWLLGRKKNMRSGSRLLFCLGHKKLEDDFSADKDCRRMK